MDLIERQKAIDALADMHCKSDEDGFLLKGRKAGRMKIGDRVFVRGYIDEIRKDTVIIRNAGGYFGTIPSEVITGELPSAQPDVPDINDGDIISRQAALDALGEAPKVWTDSPEEFAALSQWEMDVTAIKALPSEEPKTDDESELKFYYVESVDDYWVGRRLDNFYYANWHEGLGFVWSHSRYLPWGEHIVDENTLWKEHTYPSEPIEIPFTEWIVGFVKKYFAQTKTGRWILAGEQWQEDVDNGNYCFVCSECGKIDVHSKAVIVSYCWNCGARMEGSKE